jgi:3,5-epimerase/4-reductase
VYLHAAIVGHLKPACCAFADRLAASARLQAAGCWLAYHHILLSCVQALVEGLLKEFPNTLVLRVRMPIVADLTYPRNFITKIIKYDRVRDCTKRCFLVRLYCYNGVIMQAVDRSRLIVSIPWLQIINIPNSMTVLPELLPLSIKMVNLVHAADTTCPSSTLFLHAASLRCCCERHAVHAVLCNAVCCPDMRRCLTQAERKLTGIMNYTNPGAVSHNEILQMYKDYIDPEFTWKNFTVEEQAKVIVAPRSNNLLDTKRVCLLWGPLFLARY